MRLKSFPTLLSVLTLFSATAAGAESLNDHNIRALFGRIDSSIHDMEATRKITDSAYDNAYVRNSEITATFASQPPAVFPMVYTKSQLLLGIVNGFSAMKILSYERTISSIKFTEDKNWAYVYSKVSSTGTMGSGGSAQLRFSNASSCVDTLAIRDGGLKLMRSDCKETSKMNNI